MAKRIGSTGLIEPSDRMTALLWCVEKRNGHIIRAMALAGMIVILKVFKVQIGDSPFLPFKLGPKDTTVVLGILGALLWGSILAQAHYAQKIEKLKALGVDDVTRVLAGDVRKKPKGWEIIPFGLGAGTMLCVMFVFGMFTLEDTFQLLDALLGIKH